MNLRPYQIVGRDWLAARTRGMLADEMRVGKTPQAILAAAKLGAQRTLALCPAIAVEHWKREWTKWGGQGRLDAMSYDAARNLWTCGALKGHRWDVLVVDEAHFAKNPEAQRTKMVYGKEGLGHQAGAIWPLSGTPTPNHAGELWPMLRAFGVVKVAYDPFVRYFCHWNDFLGRIDGNRPEHMAELRALIAPVVLRRKRAEVAPEMPALSWNDMEVEPQGPDFATAELDLVDRQDRIDVASAKAPQLAAEIAGALEGRLYEQTVVFGYHLEPLAILRDELARRGVRSATLSGETPHRQREHIQDGFRMGLLPAVLAQIIAAGTAIDLSAARHGYFLELDFVPGNNEQAANRLVSMERNDPVTLDVVMWPGTRDSAVQRILLRKMRDAVFA